MCAMLPRRLIEVLQRGRSLRLPRLGWNLRGRLPGGGEAAGWRVQLHGVVFPDVWHRRQSACQCMPSQGEWHAGVCQGRSAAASPAYSTIRPLARPSPLPAAGLAASPHCPPNLPCPALPCPAMLPLLQCAGDGVRFECSVLGNPDACQNECARAAGKETNFEADDGSLGGPAGDAACQACAMSKAPAAPQCSMAGVVFESACHLKAGGCIA